MTLDDIAQALTRAGFVGVEIAPPLVYARGDGPSAPEFTAEPAAAQAGGVLLTQRFDVRAPQAAILDWKIGSDRKIGPDSKIGHNGRLAIVNGETHLTLVVLEPDMPQALTAWRSLMQAASKAAITWRRSQRPLHGM